MQELRRAELGLLFSEWCLVGAVAVLFVAAILRLIAMRAEINRLRKEMKANG